MDSHPTSSLETIRKQIATQEAQIAALHLSIANRPVSFEDLLRVSNLLGLMVDELDRWKTLEQLVHSSMP